MFIKQNNAKKAIAALLLAGIGIMMLSFVLGSSRLIGYRFIWALAASVLGLSGYRFFKLGDMRIKRWFGSLGFLFATAQVLGYRLQVANRTGVDGLLLCLGIGACLAPALGYGFILLSEFINRIQKAGQFTLKLTHGRVFWISFVVILICWVPVFLAYYPGLFAYDVNRQISEVISGQLTNQNPLLHTLYLGGMYLLGGALGDFNIGIALSVILQMIFMAGVFAWLLRYLTILNSPRALCLITLFWFALFPVHSILAISCTKDILFCGMLLLFVIHFHRMICTPTLLKEVKWVTEASSLIVLMCLLRNNALFGVFMCIPLSLFVIPRKFRLRLVALFLGSLILNTAVLQGLKAITHAGGMNTVELVSIPSQQMARVYNLYRDEYPPSVEIEAYLPTAAYYSPYTADAVKTFAEIKQPGQLWGFIKLWGKVGLQYPIEYLDAFLLTMQGYWWLDDTAHARIYGEGLESRQGYLLTDTKEGFGVNHISLLLPLETLYEKLFSANEYQSIPILSLLFSPGLYLWLAAFALIRAMINKQRAIAVICGFLFCYMIPLWFGACALIRYAYPFIVCAPLLLNIPQEPRRSTLGEVDEFYASNLASSDESSHVSPTST